MSQVIPSAAAQRFHALDAVRAGALLLGILGHAAMSFFPTPIWITQDSDPTPVLSNFFLTQHIFRMSLFFMIAGFFAHMMLHKRGLGAFVKDRLKRIALPLVVFWPALFAAFIAIVIWSVMRTAGPEALQAGGQPSLTWQTVPLLHTWFLYVLIFLYAGALVLFGVSRLIDRGGHIGRALDAAVRVLARTHLLPVVLAAPLAAVFYVHASWIPWGGIRTPDTGLAPNIPAMVAFATAFGIGWLLHRQTDLLNVWRRWWPLYLAAAIGLTVLVMRAMAAGSDPAATIAAMTDPQGASLYVSAIYPLAVWTWVFGLTGLALRVLTGENKVVRYLADSSYWLYLIHLPIVMVLQVIVSQWSVGWYVKFPLIIAVSMAVMLASYQLLVRNTPVGGWLNGRRYGRRAQPAMIQAVAAE